VTTTTGIEASAPRTGAVITQAAPAQLHVGPIDHLSVEDVVALIPTLPIWDGVPKRKRGSRLRGAAAILRWLEQHPAGDGWQERWVAADADRHTRWLDEIVATDPRTLAVKRAEMTNGLCCLLLCRTVLPGYDFLARYKAHGLFKWVRQVFSPDLFARMEQLGDEQGMQGPHMLDGLLAVSKLVLHTGRDVDQLLAEDVYEYHRGLHSADRGVHAAWNLLQSTGVLPADISLRTPLFGSQRSTEDLVDYYRLQCRPVRDVLVRYLNERRPGLDYSSIFALAATLAGLFWADIERHHPGLNTFNLPPDVAADWKQRLRFVTTSKGERKPRKNHLNALAQVRSFYLDIQEWALEDPRWAPWAAPSPVRRGDLIGMGKARKKTVSEMHQRVRERLPHLSILADNAEAHRSGQAQLLSVAKPVPIGQTFQHNGVTYQRTIYKSYAKVPSRQKTTTVLIENIAAGEQIDVTETEEDAFWTWAIIETLRHTGVRIEELLEITHLALVSYRLPDTGEIVPLLQIVPSKGNEERLLLVSPELASVLASVVKRLRDDNGTIPVVARYDHHEKVTGPPLPHLFQRRLGWRHAVISPAVVKRMLTDALTRTGLRDAAGQPLLYTPHDFRRIFTTEAVTGGLPVHIAARLLGHASLATTQTYLAVFQDDLIRTYRAFLDKRRAVRPEAEYREPTEEEWREFQQHFEVRKLELGDCGRPYGSPCQREHSCLRCPMLRVSPQQRPRLIEIIRNLDDRITEAKINGWQGEVQGLRISLTKAKEKLATLNRSIARARDTGRSGPTDLGIPTITTSR
jgi:site-specific recombinase XerD